MQSLSLADEAVAFAAKHGLLLRWMVEAVLMLGEDAEEELCFPFEVAEFCLLWHVVIFVALGELEVAFAVAA